MSSCQLMCIALEFTLFLCFRLSRLLYLSTALILSVVLAGTVAVLLCHALSARGRAGSMARRPVLNGGEELEVRVEYSFFRKVAGLPSRYSLDALASATDDFRCVVGRGSSGTVFMALGRPWHAWWRCWRRGVEPPPPSDMIVVDLLALDPAHGHRVGPFGLPLLPAGSAGTAASSVMSVKRLVRTLILVGTVACVCSASHGMHAPTSKA